MAELLIDPQGLASLLPDSSLLLLDVRYDLFDHGAGPAAYRQGHIPGAVFVDLEGVLSGQKTGRNGRHPLPDIGAFAQSMGHLGLKSTTRVVVYDAGNSMAATRLWWMLRWIGHESVRILDGGWSAWLAAGGSQVTQPLRYADPVRGLAVSQDYTRIQPCMPAFTVDFIEHHLDDARWRLLDARSAERYRGETEPIDPVAGHIPGALNWPNPLNLAPDSRFRAADELRADYLRLLDGHPPESVIHQCGSGISACHNLFAMELAGLTGSGLYVGSWSEWCSDPARPVATGESV